MKKKPMRKIIEQDEEGNFTKKQIKEAVEKSSKLKKVIESSDIIRFKKFPKELDKVARYVKKPIPVRAVMMAQEFEVETLEGVMKGKHGDYLVEGVEGEVYPCNRLIFEKTYKKYKKQNTYDDHGKITLLVMLIIGTILYAIVYDYVHPLLILMIAVIFIAELILRYKYKKDEEKRKHGNKNR